MGYEVKIIDGFYSMHLNRMLNIDKKELTNFIVGIGGTIAPVGFTLPEIEKNQIKKSNRASIMVIFILSMLLSLVLGELSTGLYFKGKDEIRELQAQVTQKSYIQKLYDQQSEAKSQLASANEMKALTFTSNSMLYDLIEQLEKMIPSSMHVNSLSVTTTSINMSIVGENILSVGQMLINFKSIPLIQNVKLSSYSEEEGEDGGNQVALSTTFEYATKDLENEKGGN